MDAVGGPVPLIASSVRSFEVVTLVPEAGAGGGAAGGGGSVSELWTSLLKGEGTLVLIDTAVSSFVGSPLGISSESAARTYLLRLLLKVSGRRERAGGAIPLALPRCMALIILQSPATNLQRRRSHD